MNAKKSTRSPLKRIVRGHAPAATAAKPVMRKHCGCCGKFVGKAAWRSADSRHPPLCQPCKWELISY